MKESEKKLLRQLGLHSRKLVQVSKMSNDEIDTAIFMLPVRLFYLDLRN